MRHKKRVLSNGLRIITVPMKDNPAVTVLVMVEAGSKYEAKNKNGLSHFLEHMCFKGTERRPTAFHVTEELDSIGAQYNAFTSQEFTGYYAKSHPKHFSKILDVVSDIYLNQKFPEKEIEKERGVIIEEINMYEDQPQRRVWDAFFSLLYGDTPAGWTILGPKENIKKLSRDDFVDYRDKHYVARGTTIIVAGQVGEKEAVAAVKAAFGTIPETKKHSKKRTEEKQKGARLLVRGKKTDQAHMILGVRAFKASDKRVPALRVLNAVLGSGMSSRLFQKLRDEMGIGYYVRSVYDAYTDHGFLAVWAGVAKNRLLEGAEAIMNELKRLKDEPVSPKELKKAKDYLIGTAALDLESSDSVAEFYAEQEILTGETRDLNAVTQKIKAITARDVQKVARDILTNDRLNMAVIANLRPSEKAAVKKTLTFKP